MRFRIGYHNQQKWQDDHPYKAIASLVDKLDNLARKVESSRSELIRRLISESLLEKEKEEIEAGLKEGYLANYEFVKESSREWDFTSGDGL